MALILGCQAISKSYGARLLFENISMGISDGERVGLIGPNGAGKSTFLRLLLGIEPPDSGKISIRKLARVSHVAQDPLFPADKTVGQVLQEALVPLRLDEAERVGRLSVILGRLGFASADVPVETLSGGWSKRLAIGCGLIQNGSGKTTLLKLLNGELTPGAGRLERAEGLRIVTFDQNRQELNPAETLRQALAPAGDSVIYRERSLHVNSWAKRFLFRTEQLELPVSQLSGGKQARVMIARMMLEPADVLLLDEPTNDLDIPTLEVLEESLSDFAGALVLVTHDRYLLDRVSTAILALDGKGKAELFADYDQWRQFQKRIEPSLRSRESAGSKEKAAGPERQKRLSYLDRLEWDRMEEMILAAEEELEAKQQAAAHPAIASDADELIVAHEALEQARQRIDQLYARWAELEAKLQ